MEEILGGWLPKDKRKPPASDDDLDSLEQAFEGLLPPSYRALLRWSNGGTGWARTETPDRREGFEVWPAQGAPRRNRDYAIQTHLPGTWAFASDGGDRWYLFDTREPAPDGEFPILVVDPGDPYFEEAGVAAWNLVDLFRLGPRPQYPLDGIFPRDSYDLRPLATGEPATSDPRRLACFLGNAVPSSPLDVDTVAIPIRLETDGRALLPEEHRYLPAPYTARLAKLLLELAPPGWALVLSIADSGVQRALGSGVISGSELLVQELAVGTGHPGIARLPPDAMGAPLAQWYVAWEATPARLVQVIRRGWTLHRWGQQAAFQAAVVPPNWPTAVQAWHDATDDPREAVGGLLRLALACVDVWPSGDGLTVYSTHLSRAEIEAAAARATTACNMW